MCKKYLPSTQTSNVDRDLNMDGHVETNIQYVLNILYMHAF